MIVGGVIIGSGVGFLKINYVVGVVKVYIICVGDGFFLIELFDIIGDIICEVGYEYGIMIGCLCCVGWFDSVVVCYVCCVSGLIDLLLILLDVLIGIEIFKICVVYKLDGKIIIEFLVSLKDLVCCEFVYEEFLGWMEDIIGVILFDDFLVNCCYYMECIV